MKYIVTLAAIVGALMLSSCQVPGYETVPDKLTIGFPIWFGGPSMSWKFEEVQQ